MLSLCKGYWDDRRQVRRKGESLRVHGISLWTKGIQDVRCKEPQDVHLRDVKFFEDIFLYAKNDVMEKGKADSSTFVGDEALENGGETSLDSTGNEEVVV